MKRYVWMIAAFALIGLVVYGCRFKKDNTDVIDGGVRHWEDTNAPKVIQSTKITSFFCKASANSGCQVSSSGWGAYSFSHCRSKSK